MRRLAFVFLFAILLVSPAFGAGKTFVVLPFTVNGPQSYAYLSRAVSSTLQSRLTKPGALTGKTGTARAATAAEAKKALAQAKADYAIWGTVNVLGNDATVEVRTLDKSGAEWSKSASGPVSNLTATVNGLAAAAGAEAMGEPVMARPGSVASRGAGGGQSNSDIIVNETGQNQVYLNPQFRYQGAGANDGSRLRSQRLKEGMVDMALGDFNGDGKTEIAVLSDHTLSIYLWEQGGRLKELGKTEVSRTNNNFSMRAMDLDRDGASDLIIATFDPESNRPYSFFYSFRGNKFSQTSERIPYFASVMRIPPTFAPTLVGQAWDSIKLFAPGVHQLVKSGGKYALGGRLGLPSGANVFNCAYIPAKKAEGGDLLVMSTDDERLKVFQGSGDKPIHTTMERFSGSSTGMEFYKTMPGLNVNKNSQLASKYYAPLRMISADIGNTGENVLILNKPISTASQFFDRYRYFPQGEVHALYWDGVGMGLKWKTRRIRGSVAEVDLGDVNNDGVLDLVVGINTSPELGIGSRQSMITAYPLDVSQADPNTPADMSDFEVQPR